MEIKNKWNPGGEPVQASSHGMTHKPGLTRRESFIHDYVCALIQSGKGPDYPVVGTAAEIAEKVIAELWPEPVAKVHAEQKEMSACHHEGELIMEKGKALCMRCRQVVPKDIVIARMK